MRAEIKKICNEQYNMHLGIEDITECDDCRTGRRIFSGCMDCNIKKCAISRNLESCAFCDDYFCDELHKYFTIDPSAKTTLEALRASRPV
jgi:hypothetical protein